MYNPKALYSVEMSRSPGFKMLAIDVELGEDENTKWVGFHDTQRGHQIEGELLQELPDGFIWARKIPETDTTEMFTFRILTLDRFKKEFGDRVVGPLPEFNSTEDLWEWYRRQYADRGWAF